MKSVSMPLRQSPRASEQFSSMDNQINLKHPCKHSFSSFCLLANDLFFLPFWYKQTWREFTNMVTVEASVVSLVCWNLTVFLQCGLSPGNDEQICWWFVGDFSNDTSWLKKKKKKKKKKTLCLPAKSRPRILKCLQPYISMCTCKWSYFKDLYHSICDVSLSISVRIVNKIHRQNTPEKTLKANLLKKFNWKIFIRLSAIIYKSV